jgi:hypothetical protein
MEVGAPTSANEALGSVGSEASTKPPNAAPNRTAPTVARANQPNIVSPRHFRRETKSANRLGATKSNSVKFEASPVRRNPEIS